VMAMVASALASAGRRTEARPLTLTALQLVEKNALGQPRAQDQLRALLQERLLLEVMTVPEAMAAIRAGGSLEAEATFVAVLARSGRTDLARQAAADLAQRTRGAGGPSRGRIQVSIAEALARSGDADGALTAARTIEERELLAAGLAHAAFGFADKGDRGRAEALIREVHEALPSIREVPYRSLAWATAAMARVRLGHYAAALAVPEGLPLDPSDRLLVHAAIIRDNSLRRDPALRDAFDRPSIRGLGRYDVHWP